MKAQNQVEFGDARICMPTWRTFARAPFQCYRYEAQDVLCSCDSVDLIPIEATRSLPRRERLLRRLMWYPSGRTAVRINPGLREVRLQQTYEMFVAVCESWWDLLYINAVKGWEKQCRVSVLWLDELFVGMLRKYRHWLPSLNRFDCVCLGHLRSVEEASKILGRACHWVPPAVDVLRFAPRRLSQVRPIFALSVGRRHAGIHAALKQFSEHRELLYMFDTLEGVSMVVSDPREHRELYAAKLRNSRFLLVGPGMMGEPEAANEHVIGARFFEGAAAGVVLIGERPLCLEYDILFDWPDSVFEIERGGTDTERVLDMLLADEGRIERASAAGVRECAARHDWVHRWRSIYEIVGLEVTAEMLQREREVEDLANRFRLPRDLSRSACLQGKNDG